MATYQIEQYYVHVKTTGSTSETLEKIRVLLIENDWQDYEFNGDDLTINGFESEQEADKCNLMIIEHLDF